MKITDKKIYRLNPDCDQTRLLEIVSVNNAAIARGERCPICLGHTPGSEATEFLTIDVGEAREFRTDGEFILCEMEIDEAFAEAVKRHRGVSVELWSDNRLYPISLLAHNRPALEVEPMKYAREGEHTTHLLPEPDEELDMDAIAVKNLISECLLSSDLAAQINSLTDSVSQLSLQCQTMDETHSKLKWLFEEEEQEEEEDEEGGELPPEVAKEEAGEPHSEAVAEDAAAESKEHPELPKETVEQIAEDHVAKGEGKEDKPEVEEKDEMAMPSGTNTFVPAVGGGAPPKKKKNYEELALESETYRLAAENQKAVADGYASQIEAVAAEKNAVAQKVAELEHKYAMLARKNELIVLAGKYEFDPDAEMALVEKMDDAQYEQHKKLVVTRYAMPPVNKPPVVVGELPKADPIEPVAEVIPQAQVAKVAKYAMQHKIDFNKAWDMREQIWRGTAS